jgi:hypothetical protein
MTNNDAVTRLLGDDFTKGIVRDLGIENESSEIQAKVVDRLGQAIFERIVLEVLKVLPPSEHDAFESFMGNGDFAGLQAFLQEKVPDGESLVQKAASDTYESVKARAARIERGEE